MTITDVLEKYFKDEKVLGFHSSDKLEMVEGNSYLRYQKDAGVQLWVGGNNGEVCICVTSNPETLETLIKAIIYSY
jgi:hypothetical protein